MFRGPAAKLSEDLIYSLDPPWHDGGIHIDTTTTPVAYSASIMELVVYAILSLANLFLNLTSWL